MKHWRAPPAPWLTAGGPFGLFAAALALDTIGDHADRDIAKEADDENDDENNLADALMLALKDGD